MSHPTRHQLERFFAGDANEYVETHLKACAECHSTIEQLESDKRALLARRPAAVFTAQVYEEVERRRKTAKVVPLFRYAAIATAATVLIGLGIGAYWASLPGAPPDSVGFSDLQWKGGESSMKVFAERQGAVLEIRPDDVQPFDALRFHVRVKDGARGYVAVYAAVSEKGRHLVTPILPDSPRKKPFSFTTSIIIPGSVKVDDDAEGAEILVYVSPKPFAFDEAAEAIETSLSKNPSAKTDASLYRLRIAGVK